MSKTKSQDEGFRRADPDLNEILRHLDRHFEFCNYDPSVAWQTLSKSQLEFIESEIHRCALDIRYYLENYHLIKTKSEGWQTFYPLWDSQEIFLAKVISLQMAGRTVQIIVLKARQLGLSTITQAIIFHKTIFTETCNSLIVAQDPDQSAYIFEMSRNAYERLPWWMRPERRYEARGKYLTFDRNSPEERMRRPGLNSTIFVEAANKMSGVAQGRTMRAAHLTELAKWPDGGVLSQQLLPSINAEDRIVVMESTAQGTDNFWYGLWTDALEGRIPWEPIFIPFYRVRDQYSIPIPKGEKFERTDEERALCVKVRDEDNFNITDGTLNWRRAKIAEFVAVNGDEWMFYESYPLNWREAFQATGICAFNKRKLQSIIESSCRHPVWIGEVGFDPGKKEPRIKLRPFDPKVGRLPSRDTTGARLHVWLKPEKDAKYYIGADVAYGIEQGDYSACQIFRIGDGCKPDMQVAEWKGWINATPYAHVLAALGVWYNKAEIACEANDIGRTTNNELFRGIEYEQMYRWKHPDKIKNFMSDFFGFETNVKSRPAIINAFREGIDENTMVLMSEELVTQAMNFGGELGGRMEGQGGMNDDLIMSAMICFYCAHEMEWGQAQDHDKKEAPSRYVDFYNTDYSPIYDKAGLRREMVFGRNIPAEVIMYDQLESGTGMVTEDDKWRMW